MLTERQIYYGYYPKEEEELSCDEYIPRNRHYYDMVPKEGWPSQHYEESSNSQKVVCVYVCTMKKKKNLFLLVYILRQV
jgi:hypothetical protein